MSPRCKRAKELNIDNCHEGYDGEEKYCLFHRPEKNENEAEKFYELITGFARKKEIENEKLDLVSSNKKILIFDLPMYFEGYIFPKVPTNLGYSFEGIIFKDDVDFSGTEFEFEVSFYFSVFKGYTRFRNAVFKEKVDFSEAIFDGTVDFSKALFIDESCFSDSTFKDYYSFSNTVFEEKAEFQNTKFELDKYDPTVMINGSFSFKDTSFREIAIFSAAAFNCKVDFEGAIFERACDFSEAIFSEELIFTNTKFEQGVTMIRDIENPQMNFFEKEQAKEEAFRVQKISFEEEGRKADADKMFAEEMRARRAQKRDTLSFRDPGEFIDKMWAYLEQPLADWTCEYGTSWKNILRSSGLVGLFFTFVYWFGSALTKADISYVTEGSVESLSVSGFLDSLYYSVVTFTTLGYGDIHPTGYLKAASAIESVVGAILMALLVAVFARKWMR